MGVVFCGVGASEMGLRIGCGGGRVVKYGAFGEGVGGGEWICRGVE